MRELAGRIHPLPVTLGHAMDLKYRDFLTVALMIRSDDLFPDNWIYIHDSKVQVGRVQNSRSWSPEMVPDAGIACVGLEYFCFEGDGLWSARDDELIEMAKIGLTLLGLCASADVVGGAVVRQEKDNSVSNATYDNNWSIVGIEMEEKYTNKDG